jgi:hypothetical protein
MNRRRSAKDCNVLEIAYILKFETVELKSSHLWGEDVG